MEEFESSSTYTSYQYISYLNLDMLSPNFSHSVSNPLYILFLN